MGSTAWTKGRCWMIFSTFCRASASCLCGASPGSGSPAGDAPLCAVCLAVWVEDVVRHREHECAAPLLFSDEAVMQLVGFNAQQVRQGICQRGATKRQGERSPGPICPEMLANNIRKVNLRDLESLFNGAI